MTKLILALALAAGAVTPSVASADVFDEINAADAVERKLDHRYPEFTHAVSCRQLSRVSFTCTYSGFSDDAVSNGRASARKQGRGYRVTIRTHRVTRF